MAARAPFLSGRISLSEFPHYADLTLPDGSMEHPEPSSGRPSRPSSSAYFLQL